MRNIFLSFASEQSDLAERLGNRLRQAGHEVFTRTDLPSGEPFDQEIRKQIEASDLFIFLISSASVTKGRYTLTELGFAERKWRSPHGSVLPVMVEPTAIEKIPSYLSTLNILEPRGDLAAETVAQVDMLDKIAGSTVRESERHTSRLWMTAFAAGLLVGIAIGILAGRSFRGARLPNQPAGFDFEDNAELQRWLPQDYPGIYGVRSLFQTTAQAHSGTHSLCASVKLKGGDADYGAGEMYGSILAPDGEGRRAPVDLFGQQVVVWIFVPRTTVKGSGVGELRLFVKDSQWRGLYGPPFRLTDESLGHWFVLTLVPGAPGSHAYLEPGFDARNAATIGVRLSAGGDPSSVFEGDLFVDGVIW